MKRLVFALTCCMTVAVVANAQQPYGPWIDASQFGKGDICLDIQAAIAALPAAPSPSPGPGGAVIDARNFAPPASQTFIHCAANPFAVATLPVSPVVLANGGNVGGNCNSTTAAPGCLGGVLLLPGFTISTDVPWLVPGNWSIFGQGAKVSVIAPSSASTSTFKPFYNVGTIVGVSGNTLTGSGTTWSTGTSGNVEVGMVLTACTAALCNATATSYSNATAVGIVTVTTNSTTLSLGSAPQATFSAISPGSYVLQSPVLAWATTQACSSSCQGALTNQTFGSVIQDIGISCAVNAGGGAPVAGCIPFWDQYGQERSQLKRVSISGFLSLGIGIYTSNAQNGGPFEDLQMTSGPTATVAGTTCVGVGGVGGSTSMTSMGQPPMRGIRGLTCTNSTLGNVNSAGVGLTSTPRTSRFRTLTSRTTTSALRLAISPQRGEFGFPT